MWSSTQACWVPLQVVIPSGFNVMWTRASQHRTFREDDERHRSSGHGNIEILRIVHFGGIQKQHMIKLKPFDQQGRCKAAAINSSADMPCSVPDVPGHLLQTPMLRSLEFP